MQLHPNNDLYNIPSEKEKGIIGTIVIHAVILVLLIVLGFSVPPPPETEEGILVNFGTDETGFGMIEPSPPPSREEASVPLPSESTVTAREEPLLTQDTEEAPEVKKVDPEAEKRRIEQAEAEKRRRAELEAERIRKEQEEIERKRIEAEQKRQADIMNRTKDALAGSKIQVHLPQAKVWQADQVIRDPRAVHWTQRTEAREADSVTKEYLTILRAEEYNVFPSPNITTRAREE